MQVDSFKCWWKVNPTSPVNLWTVHSPFIGETSIKNSYKQYCYNVKIFCLYCLFFISFCMLKWLPIKRIEKRKRWMRLEWRRRKQKRISLKCQTMTFFPLLLFWSIPCLPTLMSCWHPFWLTLTCLPSFSAQQAILIWELRNHIVLFVIINIMTLQRAAGFYLNGKK